MFQEKLIVLAVAASCGIGAVNANESLSIPNEANYIVVFNTPSVLNLNNAGGVSSYASSMGARLSNQMGIKVQKDFGDVLNGVLVKANRAQLKAMRNDPNVKYIELDQVVQVNPISTNADQASPTWGLDRIDQSNLPLDNNYHYDFDGTGVTAYVIDTGVRNSHNEFNGRATSGYDFVDNDSDATDCNGHGTHVAGTIAGSSYGVAKNANIVGVRVLDCAGSGTNSGVIDGINWVKNNAVAPAVANMSLGGGASQALDDAVNAAVAAGITFVVAAGNDNRNACNYSPARAADAITVGSTTSTDARSSFSNYGSCLDIYAPGSSITSAWYNSNSATNTISGTSMAAPHVAGVAALLLDETSSLSPSQLQATMLARSSADKVSDAKTGSPNQLLFSLANDDGGGGCTTDCNQDNVLNNAEVVSINGASDSEVVYSIEVPADSSHLDVLMSGGSGDADIYVSYGQAPTRTSYQCRPYKNGNNESCQFDNPQAGQWYVMVHGYSTYSGADLSATYTTGGGGQDQCTDANCLENGVTLTGLSGNRRSTVFYKTYVPAGSTLTVSTSGGSGDADLYVNAGSEPTTSNYDCRPYKSGNVESCSFNVQESGYYHVMIRGYRSYSGLNLTATY